MFGGTLAFGKRSPRPCGSYGAAAGVPVVMRSYGGGGAVALAIVVKVRIVGDLPYLAAYVIGVDNRGHAALL